MRLGLLALGLATLLLAGCSSSPKDEGAVKSGDGVAQNPTGKPQNDADQTMANQMKQQGDAMNKQREADAKAMAEAKAKAGGQ